MNRDTNSLPCINLNGSSAFRLAEDYKSALDLARQLSEALHKIDFHPRNYPIPGTWESAKEEFGQVRRSADEIQTYLKEHFYHCKKSIK